jgi:hypothetical protein
MQDCQEHNCITGYFSKAVLFGDGLELDSGAYYVENNLLLYLESLLQFFSPVSPYDNGKKYFPLLICQLNGAVRNKHCSVQLMVDTEKIVS